MGQHRAEFGLLVAMSVGTVLASPGVALAKGYAPGFYSGHTGQGRPITFLVANGEVTNLDTGIVDACNPGTYNVSLYPDSSRINAAGSWSCRAAEDPSQPTIYHGQLSGRSASGTITDTSDNSRGKACHGYTTFRATVSDPVGIAKATVGNRGTDVELNVSMPSASDGNLLVPYTPTALLVYGSNVGCPATYAAADQLARTEDSDGFDGLISDGYVDSDYETQPYQDACTTPTRAAYSPSTSRPTRYCRRRATRARTRPCARCFTAASRQARRRRATLRFRRHATRSCSAPHPQQPTLIGAQSRP